MAISIASFNQTAWNSTTTPKTITSLSWSSGDIIVVAGAVANNNTNEIINVPTNANLTFSQVATTGGTANTECKMYIWTATAGSSQTGQTISATFGTGVAQHWGFGCWIVAGASAVGVSLANQTESTLSLTVSSGSAVFYIGADYNATTGPSRTIATGSGTATERADDESAGQYAWFLGDWVGTSAGTFGFGVTSYTSWKVAQVAVELTAAGGTDATATPDAIVAAVTMDAPTESAGSTITVNEIVASATFDAPTESTSETGTPATIIAAASLDAVTAQRSETSTPATIIAGVTIDAVTASASNDASPATIAVIAALDAAAASGGTNATATPAEIVATAALDAVTASGTSNATPAPDAIIVPVSLDAATATGGSASTATPAAIIATAALDAVSPSAGSTVTVTEIVALASFDAATATGESNATPAPNAIVAVVTLDAVTATGGSAGTASPATITATASFDAPAYTAGGTASPAALEVLAVLPAVFTIGNGVFAPGSIVVVIRRQDRTLDVEAVSRVYAVPARSRTLEVIDAD